MNNYILSENPWNIIKLYNVWCVWPLSERTTCNNMQQMIHKCCMLLGKKFGSFDRGLRDQNSQHFNENLLAVNASAFSFVLCFKAFDYADASNDVMSANWTSLENFRWNCSAIRIFSRETMTNVHWYLDCLNFNYYCLVENSKETRLWTSKIFRSNYLFWNLKSQTDTADKGVVLL